MPIQKPINAIPQRRRKTSVLIFPDGSQAEYYLRGGICWPMPFKEGNINVIRGFVLICGVHTKTGVVSVFEQTPFASVDHLINSKGIIVDGGIGACKLFNLAWQTYYCRKYYFHQQTHTHNMFRKQVRASRMIDPKPSFKFIDWKDDEDIAITMWAKTHRKQLLIDGDSPLADQLKSYQANPAVVSTGRWALLCALAGMDKYSWRANEDMDP